MIGNVCATLANIFENLGLQFPEKTERMRPENSSP